MSRTCSAFLTDDSGAITIDWVVLSAAALALGLGVIAIVGNGQRNVATGLSNDLATPAVRGTPAVNGGNPKPSAPFSSP